MGVNIAQSARLLSSSSRHQACLLPRFFSTCTTPLRSPSNDLNFNYPSSFSRTNTNANNTTTTRNQTRPPPRGFPQTDASTSSITDFLPSRPNRNPARSGSATGSSSASASLAERIAAYDNTKPRRRTSSSPLSSPSSTSPTGLTPGDPTALSDATNRLTTLQRARDLRAHAPRRWNAGDVYAPHDLSPMEQSKWRVRQTGYRDVFDVLGLDPLAEWKNFSILEEFRTGMGRIRHRRETGLRAVNQRKVSKAIRRAVAFGWLPSIHRHPEMVERDEERRNIRRFGLDGRKGVIRQ